MKKRTKPQPDTLGQRIRQLRKLREWSQDDLGKKIGSHWQTVARYEKGFVTPSADTVQKIAEVFGVTTDFLLFGANEGGAAKIRNKELLKRVEQLDKINPDAIKDLLGVMDVYIRDHQVKELAKAS